MRQIVLPKQDAGQDRLAKTSCLVWQDVLPKQSPGGGIARVFGRPKILEFVHDDQEQKSRDEAGIYSFRDFLSYGHWQEQGTRPISKENAHEEGRVEPAYPRKDFAPHPNLSLNVGIKKRHWTCFYLAAILGFVLQAGVLAFAALVTYKYPSEFQRDDTQIAVPAFQFVCAGTVLLCIGVGMCAFIIERSTYERTFERKGKDSSRFYWIQPGDQIVGDQVFESFAYSDAKHKIKKYITSKSETERRNDNTRFIRKQSVFVWVATVTTTIGFVLQFLGLRTVHSTVSVAQLGAMLIMSIVRAFLRTRHLKEEHNLLGDSSTLYVHHELDWLAIEMAQENEKDSAQGLLDKSRKFKPFWHVTGPAKPTLVSSQRDIPENLNDKADKAAKAYVKRVKLAQMTGARTLTSAISISDPWEDSMIASRAWASKLACAIEGVMKTVSLRCTIKDTLRQEQISWGLRCCMSTAFGTKPFESMLTLNITHEIEGIGLHGPWKSDRAQLEGVLGLWLWSIISRERIRQANEEDSPNNRFPRTSRIVSILTSSSPSDFEAGMELWLGSHSTPLQETKLLLANTTFHPASLWVEELNGLLYKQVDENALNGRCSTVRRMFGSNVIPNNIIPDDQNKPLKALHAPSVSSLEMMCTQELFAIFFNTIVQEIDDLKGTTEIVQSPDRFHVANSTISEMIENFTSSGIGSHDDSIACMIPVLHLAQKLSYSSPFMDARATGEMYHQMKDWSKAENALSPALKLALQDFKHSTAISLPGETERTEEIHVCLLSLCEMYRLALLGDKQSCLFGLRGFNSLFDMWKDYGKIPEDLLLYQRVACRMVGFASQNDIFRAAQELRTQPKQTSSKVEIYNNYDFLDEIYNGTLEGVLSSLKSDVLETYSRRKILTIASKNGWYPVMKSLKWLGINTRDVDNRGFNYLHYAAQVCTASMIKELAGNDSDLLLQHGYHGETPLHLAAAAGKTNVVMALTQHFSIKINTRDRYLRSPLDNAILADHADTFTFLSKLEKGETAESSAKGGWDLETKRLFQAACCCSTNIVSKLLATIINSNSIKRLHDNLVQCKQNLETHASDHSQDFIKVIEYLRENACDADDWEIEGRTAISFAAEANRVDLITHLFQICAPASIVAKDKNGRTCLHHAVISEAESAVEVLIESKYASNLLLKDEDSLDPLEYALRNRSFTIASIILRKDPRREQFILPGTSIAAGRSCIYFQGTDSHIRRISLPAKESNKTLCTTLEPSAKLHTPLAVVQVGNEDEIFYISNNNTIRHLRSCNQGESFQQIWGLPQRTKVHARSSLAALISDNTCYLYYQDNSNYIWERILKPNDYRAWFLSSIKVAEAMIGSEIIAEQAEHKGDDEVGFSRNIYFRNKYFEIDKAFTKKGSHHSEAILTPSWIDDPGSPGLVQLQSEKGGGITIYGSQNALHKSLIMNTNDRRLQSQFVVNPDPNSDALYYQSMLGDIRQLSMENTSGSLPMFVGEERIPVLVKADTGEVVPLGDEGVSLSKPSMASTSES